MKELLPLLCVLMLVRDCIGLVWNPEPNSRIDLKGKLVPLLCVLMLVRDFIGLVWNPEPNSRIDLKR